MKKLFNDLGISRAINQSRKMTVNRKPTGLEFLMSRWNTDTHTFIPASREFSPSLEDVAMFGAAQ